LHILALFYPPLLVVCARRRVQLGRYSFPTRRSSDLSGGIGRGWLSSGCWGFCVMSVLSSPRTLHITAGVVIPGGIVDCCRHRRQAPTQATSSDSADGDGVDELLVASVQGRFDIGDGGHFPEDARPAAGDIAMIGVRPPDAPQDPGLPILAAGNGRPLIDADDMRFDRLPDVDIGVTDDVDDVAVPGIGAHRL